VKSSLAELKAFVAVAQTGHFTRAAERLEMSQSALSAAVGKLEKLLGTRLFDRHTRSSRLTPAGAALLPEAHRLVQDWERLLVNAQGFASLSRGRIVIAAPSGQCALLMPPLVREFTQAHPGVQVQLRDVPEQEVHALVRSGAADLGVASETDARTDLMATPFYSDQYIASMRADHPLARRRALEWSHVCAHGIIGPSPDNPVRRHLDARLALLGLRLDYVHEASLVWTMVGLAREGLGVAVLTTAARPVIEWRQLVIRPIGRPLITRTLVVLRQAGRALPPLAAAFRDLIVDGSCKRTK
jgi:LysR family carnitine catabolism transcriptional activator